MSPKLILYFTPGSPPARACLLLARYLELDIEVRNVNLVAGEQKSEEFSKLNPMKKVPVLIDGEFVLSESRAILAYLVNSKKPGSSLYPEDPKKRAAIDQILYNDATVLFPNLASLVRPIIFDGEKEVPQKTKDAVRDALKFFDELLDGKKFFAGDQLTIADFSILGSITSVQEMMPNLKEFSRLNKWSASLENLPSFEENRAGAVFLASLVKGVTLL